MSSEKEVLVTRRYTPVHAPGRSVTVDNVPAFEVSMDGETDLQFTMAVVDSVQECVARALAQSADADVRVEYEASAQPFVWPKRVVR